MELIKEIVMAFCVIAIALSITELLLPNSSVKRCVRFIAGLIFIISVINPFLSDGVSINFDIFSKPDLNKLEKLEEDVGNAIVSDFEKNAEDALIKVLKEKGYDIISLDIKADTDEYNNTVISEITVYSNDSEEAIRQAIKETIETEDIKIEVKKQTNQ